MRHLLVLVRAMLDVQIRRPVLFLAAVVAVTAICGLLAARIGFDSRYEALLPEGAPELKLTDEVRDKIGGARPLIVALSGAAPKERGAFGRILADHLRALPDVRLADAELPVSYLRDRALWLMEPAALEQLVPAVKGAVNVAKAQAGPFALHLDEEAEKAELDAAWQKVQDILDSQRKGDVPFDGEMRSKDGKHTFVSVMPRFKTNDLKQGRGLLLRIERLALGLGAARRGIEVRFAGALPLFQEQNQIMRNDLSRATVIALVLSVIAVIVLTRRLVTPLLIGLVLLAGITWTFALASFFVDKLNIITGFLVSVLIGLGIDFGIHIFTRFEQERKKADLEPALRTAVERLVPGALTAALTTAGTFATFAVAEFRGFSEFGIIAALGVVATLLASFIVLPPLLLLLARWRKTPPLSENRYLARFDRTPIPVPVATFIVLLFGGLAVYGAFNVMHVPYRNNFRELRGHSPATDFMDYVDANMGFGFNPAVALARDEKDASAIAAVARDIAEAQRRTAKDIRIDRVFTAADLLPKDEAAQRPHIEALRRILLDARLDPAIEKGGDKAQKLADARRMVVTEPWTLADLPEALRSRLLALDGKSVPVFLWANRQTTDADYLSVAWETELAALGKRLTDSGIAAPIADETLILAWIHHLIAADGLPLLLLASAAVLLLLFFDFRSVRRTLLVFGALATGMLCTAGLMRLWGMEVNVFNMVVIPSLIGIGVDNAVHIYHRFLQEGPEALLYAVRSTGIAALLASLTTAIGFGSALSSGHLGLRSMGSLAIVGLTATFLSATMFFPALLSLLNRMGKKSQSGK